VAWYNAAADEHILNPTGPCNDIVAFNECAYYTDPDNKRVWLINGDGLKVVDEGITFPNGIIVSADHSLLLVADSHSRWIYSFQIQPDGTLKHKQKYGYLHVPDDDSLDSGADGMTVDDQGFTYVATRLGLQVLDQLGRVHFIMRKPQDKKLSNVVFGGKDLDTLFVTCGDKVYKRKVNRKGVVPWNGPVKLPRPGL
ncbi:MAG: SMP-30/gluconolactonase/LRE family protein, partial [Planctomycetaceae bacterium]